MSEHFERGCHMRKQIGAEQVELSKELRFRNAPLALVITKVNNTSC